MKTIVSLEEGGLEGRGKKDEGRRGPRALALALALALVPVPGTSTSTSAQFDFALKTRARTTVVL